MTDLFDWEFANENPVDDLIEIIESSNPELAKIIKSGMTILGEPIVVVPTEENGWKNTSIVVTAKPECKYPGSTTLFYNRVPINLVEDEHHVNGGESSAYELFLSLGADKDNLDKSTIDTSNEFQLSVLMDKMHINATYSGLGNADKKYPVDIELPSFTLSKNTEHNLAVSKTSLRYIEGSKIKLMPVIGDPALLSVFTNTAISPFYFNSGNSLLPTPVKKAIITGSYGIAEGYTRKDFELKRKYKLCCQFGIDATALYDLNLIQSGQRLTAISQSGLDYIKNLILAPQGIEIPANTPADFYPGAEYLYIYKASYTHPDVVALPPKEGYNIGIITVGGHVVNTSPKATICFYNSNSALTFLGDDITKPASAKYKEYSDNYYTDSDLAMANSGSIVLPFYYKK